MYVCVTRIITEKEVGLSIHNRSSSEGGNTEIVAHTTTSPMIFSKKTLF